MSRRLAARARWLGPLVVVLGVAALVAACGPVVGLEEAGAGGVDLDTGGLIEEAASLAAEARDPASAAAAAAAPPAAPRGLTEELTSEVLALRGWLSLRSVFIFAALLALGWIASRMVHWLIRVAYRLGVERAAWVDNLGMVLRLLVWAWVLILILSRAWRVAPMLTLLAGGLVAAGLMVGLVKHFENLSTGIGLALRGRIKVGDQITVGEHNGMVRGVGLMHVHLRTPEGSTVYLPNRLLAGEAVAIGRARNSYPLRVRLEGEAAWSPQAIEAARWVAALSPYRDVNSRVSVQSEGKDSRVLLVEVHVWSPRLLDAAEKHLRGMLERHVGGVAGGESS
ncbi:MAG: mechanosensitive ion channel [Myxococcales bacterium]|nr:mechanosensitive ion channel [Myxococcales bacterium]MCB9701092.1 mechanosensitive ion channel [Myxococcales bacterium]